MNEAPFQESSPSEVVSPSDSNGNGVSAPPGEIDAKPQALTSQPAEVTEPQPAPVPAEAPPPARTNRLISLDAYRGFTMLAMVSAGLGMGQFLTAPNWVERAEELQSQPWEWTAADVGDRVVLGLADQLRHRDWEGCTFWDLIQPSFMFIVGVAMPFAFKKRREEGERWLRQFVHVVKRALLLILIGIFLDSFGKQIVTLQLIRVLQQIAIGYVIAFLVLHLGPRVQALAAVVLLMGHTTAFMVYGHYHKVGDKVVAWNKGTNVGAYLDQWMHAGLTEQANLWFGEWFGVNPALDLMPVSTGGYVTINAISAAATILFGVLAGELLLCGWSTGRKMRTLLLAGLGGLLLGCGLGYESPDWNALLPMVKRIWTASFGLYAAGWTCLMLLAFYFLIDVLQWRRWAFPFVVVGMNSIAIYVAAGTLRSPITSAWRPFVTGPLEFLTNIEGLDRPWQPVVMAVLVTFAMWLLCYWLYRQRIFFKV